jgi:Protein of unknown function (DUF707)
LRKNLIVVRAGDKSLHPQWMDAKRNWDIVVSYYGDHHERYAGQYDYLHLCKGSKWQGLHDFLKNDKFPLTGYEYVWFPDDDLFTNCENLNNFFEICRLMDLTIAQPALTEYSYYSWQITLKSKNFDVRITDFVEIMAPCFKLDRFEKFRSTFGENTSGHGLEWVWKKIAIEHNIFKFGVVDFTPVFHTRKVGSAGHGGSQSSPGVEMATLLKKYAVSATKPVNIKGVNFKKS